MPVDGIEVSSGVIALVGDAHACVVTSTGGVKCWGSNLTIKTLFETKEGESNVAQINIFP
jgi:hypothetical protein